MDSAIRKLPDPDDGRVETGPVQFGDDWPGLFLRGDRAFGYAMSILHLLKDPHDVLAKTQVEQLMHEMLGCNTNPAIVKELIKEMGG